MRERRYRLENRVAIVVPSSARNRSALVLDFLFL